MSLLSIEDLRVDFVTGSGRTVRAVDGVSFSLEAGEVLGLVGESGSGKTVTALSMARLVPSPPGRYAGGRVLLEGRDTLTMSARDLRKIRGGVVSYVFQEPGAALNPVIRVGAQIREALRQHRPEAATWDEVRRLLEAVGIADPEKRAACYPHEISGGMQQRVMLAMALAPRPRLLVADEPTTALDVTIQAQILELLREVRRRTGMAILLITHNLGLVADLADRLAVLYAGQVVEIGPARQVLSGPRHPYTHALLQSVPQIGLDVERLTAIPGTVPSPGAFPDGCRFHPRCPRAQSACAQAVPALAGLENGVSARCPFPLALQPSPPAPALA